MVVVKSSLVIPELTGTRYGNHICFIALQKVLVTSATAHEKQPSQLLKSTLLHQIEITDVIGNLSRRKELLHNVDTLNQF